MAQYKMEVSAMFSRDFRNGSNWGLKRRIHKVRLSVFNIPTLAKSFLKTLHYHLKSKLFINNKVGLQEKVSITFRHCYGRFHSQRDMQ